jgi:hypothetical protein
MSNPTGGFTCTACFKSYKRREHLQRHSLIHLTRRPYNCTNCDSSFARTDVLRRHSRNCNAEAGSSVSTPSRKKACNRCVRQKKACDLAQPCRNCQSKPIPCHYSLPTLEGPHRNTAVADYQHGGAWGATDNPTAIVDDARESESINPHGIDLAHNLDSFLQGTLPDFCDLPNGDVTLDWLHFFGVSNPLSSVDVGFGASQSSRRFHFLFNFTSQTGLASTFECGTSFQSQQVLESLTEECIHHDAQPISGDLDDATIIVTTNPASHWIFDPLIPKIHDIVVRLKEVVMNKPRNSPISFSWSAPIEQQCSAFFSPSNVRTFLRCYWAIWHPNVNFVHKPTFDPIEAKPCLVGAMVVIGMSYYTPWRYYRLTFRRSMRVSIATSSTTGQSLV